MNRVLLILLMTLLVGQSLSLINRPRCGLRPLHNSNVAISDDLSKIVGGNLTMPGDHPYKVALLYHGRFSCGGSIINEHVVLTAAHCIHSTSSPGFYTVVRTWSRSPLDSWAQTRTIRHVVTHPSFNANTFDNDIALVFVSQPFLFDDMYVSDICVADKDPAEDELAVVSGIFYYEIRWGATFSGGAPVAQLREAYLPITKHKDIVSQYGSTYNPATMIGAAYEGDGLDSCQGDSGGGLATTNFGKLTVVGIVSWGYGCGNIGIYTRVSAYFEWIIEQINSN